MWFEQVSVMLLVGLSMASFCAGLIDSMVGGGGLIMIPSLFSLFPNTPHAALFGTNKMSAVVGTSSAAYRYSKAVTVPWASVLPATAMALLASFVGAYAVTQFPAGPLKKALPILLLAVAVYTFMNKNLGAIHAPKLSKMAACGVSALMGAAVGFYDGFFGPGTGSFLMVGFVVLFGFDFLVASASAKIVNVGCNLASLAWFAPSSNVMWGYAAWMAVWNLAGAQLGACLAIRRGASFVRKLLLVVVSMLIAKTAWDAYSPMYF
jgi:hypothetical protein